MKKLILALIIVTGIVSCEMKPGKTYKYRIITHDATYRTNDYDTINGGCITFINECGCGGSRTGSELRLCGTYTIETLK